MFSFLFAVNVYLWVFALSMPSTFVRLLIPASLRSDMDGLNRKGGRHGPELLVDINRIQWTACAGITGRLASDSLDALHWNNWTISPEYAQLMAH